MGKTLDKMLSMVNNTKKATVVAVAATAFATGGYNCVTLGQGYKSQKNECVFDGDCYDKCPDPDSIHYYEPICISGGCICLTRINN